MLSGRVFVRNGNGPKTHYTYNDQNRRLATLKTGWMANSSFQDLHYSYDDVGNILQLANTAPIDSRNIGGPSTQS